MIDRRAEHPPWCSPAHCSVPAAVVPMGFAGGVHRSESVLLGIPEATVRGVTGPITAQLQQTLRPDAQPFVVWEINGEHVGHLDQAGELALLLVSGYLEERGELGSED